MLITLIAGISAALAASFAAGAHGADVRTPGSPGIHAVVKPGTWIRVAVTDSGFNEAGMLRTANGNLHLVWRKRFNSGKFGYGWTTISPTGQPLASGTVLSGWTSLEGDPRLVPSGSGLRLIFIGGANTDPNNFFSKGAVYTSTSPQGSSWHLVHGSMANHTVLNLGVAAVNTASGKPAAAFGLNNVLFFHAGVDPSAPAASPDETVATGPVATGIAGAALARAANGQVWVAWYDQGYRTRQILPAVRPAIKAPSSGSGSPDNEPRQQVALAARAGGGLYLAYCGASALMPCARVNLWHVGSAKPVLVPGSRTGSSGLVALTAAPGGRLWVAWYDFGANVIHAVLTNPAATGFGPVHTIKPPPATFIFNGLQIAATATRLDLTVNVLLNKPGNPIGFWHTQILAK
jgi:hypothetical protein